MPLHIYNGGEHMKRCISIFLVLCLLMGILPVMDVFAADENLKYYSYDVVDGNAVITKVDSAISGEVAIPSELDGYPVTAIGFEAFAFCTLVTGMAIPEGVAVIEEAAFYGCSSLTNVVIPHSVTSIGKGAFYECTALTTVIIPNSVTEIGDYVFAWCSALSEVTLSVNLTAISEYAFYGCSSLKHIDIQGNVTTIKKAAFYECSSLTEVGFSNNISEIEDYAFAKCGSFEAVVIPDGVTKIGEYTFSWCTNLTYVIIPDSVSIVGKFAFGGCAGLRSATIGDGIVNISEGTFYSCSALSNVIIGQRVATISNHAFVECAGLTNITIPVSVTKIGVQAFDGCTNLRTVRYCADEANWKNITIAAYNECLLNAKIIFNFEPIVNGRVAYWRLILQDDIGLGFQMEYTDAIKIDRDAYVEITVADEIVTVPVSAAMESLYINVAAAQMTDDIAVCVVSGDGVRGETGIYSVKSYADQILSGSYDKATKNMVKAVLTYGAMAQKYFNYRVDVPADSNMDFVLLEMPAEEEIKMSVCEELEGISFYGASLLYGSKLTLRYYFVTDDISRFVFMANGKQLQAEENTGLFYVQITDILPQNISNAVELTVLDDSGATSTIGYNPLDYVIRMYYKAGTSENAKKLLQALYTYHLTAKAYVA